jgi:AmmeMemoRadiSam system protein B
MFYPRDANDLLAAVDALLATRPPAPRGPTPKALIVPHAGYIYSGSIAASAYVLVAPAADRIERVVLLGPAHRVWIEGLAHPGASFLRTPLGDIEVDLEALAAASVPAHVAAHAREHSLEVQLPFIQRVLPRARVAPIVVGGARPEEVGAVLDRLWGGPETLIVISSDLSHYLPYEKARAVDRETAERVVALDDTIEPERACGAAPVDGLLWTARRRNLTARIVDLRSSGDTAGGREEVVGYGSFAFHQSA